MFSHEPRVRYRKNQLGDVICQLRFPEILAIEAKIPVDFQEAIRDEFPHYSVRREAPLPKLTGMPGNLQLEKQPQVNNYQFVSADGIWRVNLTSRYISLACNRYPRWEDFAAKLDKPLAAFIKIYRPALFERVGLRYLNFISRNALDLNGTPWRDLIESRYLGILADDDIQEAATARCTMDTELSIRGGCRAKIHAGPGRMKSPAPNIPQDPEVKFVLDLDLSMIGNVSPTMAAAALETLHVHGGTLFEGAVTDRLREAMNPL
jgi:uncharacterized protein (TIGR04255 family)